MQITVISPAKSNFAADIHDIWMYRELFYFFSWRDIKVKYKQTVLGLLWVVLQPLLMMTIFTLFFSRAMNFQPEKLPYPVFCFTGLLFWNLFSSGLSSAGNSMLNNSNIIKKIYFPRLIIPFSSVIVSLFDFLVTTVIFVFVLAYWRFIPSPNIIYCFPLALIITLFTTSGAGILLSALNIKYRDFRYIIPFMIQILLFVTPVIYPIYLIKNELAREILNLNPIATAIQLAQTGLSGEEINWSAVTVGMTVSVLLFFLGLFVFRNVENEFADIA